MEETHYRGLRGSSSSDSVNNSYASAVKAKHAKSQSPSKEFGQQSHQQQYTNQNIGTYKNPTESHASLEQRAQKYNPFNKPFVLAQKTGMSALEAARLTGTASKVSKTSALSKPSGAWPAALKAYVSKVFESVRVADRPLVEKKLKALIDKHVTENTMWSAAWEYMPVPNPNTDISDLPEIKQGRPHEFVPIQLPSKPQKKKFVSLEEQFPDSNSSLKKRKPNPDLMDVDDFEITKSPVMRDSKDNSDYHLYSSRKGDHSASNSADESDYSSYSSRQNKHSTRTRIGAPSSLSKKTKKDLDRAKAIKKESKKESKKEHIMANPWGEMKSVGIEDDIKLQRKNRFEQEQKEVLSKMKKKQVQPDQQVAQPTFLHATDNPDQFDWNSNQNAIIGTCAEMEKNYLRLTSAPDPSTVRPLSILAQTLMLLKSKWRLEKNYTYICDQFKSLRQDLTVQRIKNDFTVKVYEMHSRIAIEKGDLGEFNQCSAQLQQLYTLHNLDGNKDEFTAYRILYMIHTLNKRDLANLISTLDSKLVGPCVKHALAVRSSLSTGDYNSFFKLYMDAPNCGGWLIDQFLQRERVNTLLKLARTYRPTLPVEFFAAKLGFMKNITANGEAVDEISKKERSETFFWIKSIGVTVEKGIIDCKKAVAVLNVLRTEMGIRGIDIKGQIH